MLWQSSGGSMSLSSYLLTVPNLIAFLAVDIRQPPFETLEQLADHPLYKLGTLGGTAWVDEMRVNFIALKKVLHNIVQTCKPCQ